MSQYILETEDGQEVIDDKIDDLAIAKATHAFTCKDEIRVNLPSEALREMQYRIHELVVEIQKQYNVV